MPALHTRGHIDTVVIQGAHSIEENTPPRYSQAGRSPKSLDHSTAVVGTTRAETTKPAKRMFRGTTHWPTPDYYPGVLWMTDSNTPGVVRLAPPFLLLTTREHRPAELARPFLLLTTREHHPAELLSMPPETHDGAA